MMLMIASMNVIENKRGYTRRKMGKDPGGEVSQLSNIDRFGNIELLHSLLHFLSCETVKNEGETRGRVKYVL